MCGVMGIGRGRGPVDDNLSESRCRLDGSNDLCCWCRDCMIALGPKIICTNL